MDPISIIALVGTCLKIFKSIAKWIKRHMNHVYKHDHRILKILRDYFKVYSGGLIPDHVNSMLEYIKKEKRTRWMEAPGARATIASVGEGDDSGYLTSISDTEDDASDDEYDSDELDELDDEDDEDGEFSDESEDEDEVEDDDDEEDYLDEGDDFEEDAASYDDDSD
ncbi:uncharacterized protein LTHEOB_7477 [Neofusicoccum parvum]|nr:uncharacterized protein LTHEOB_7477 [Neofusicoccum parvum]